jgi:hypothetical protein
MTPSEQGMIMLVGCFSVPFVLGWIIGVWAYKKHSSDGWGGFIPRFIRERLK